MYHFLNFVFYICALDQNFCNISMYLSFVMHFPEWPEHVAAIRCVWCTVIYGSALVGFHNVSNCSVHSCGTIKMSTDI